MNRRKAELQAIDLGQWPTVAYTDFDPRAKAAFQIRMLAVQQYANGRAIKGIELEHGINRRQLYRWLDRALAQHDDGRINGYRGLISGVHCNRYERINPVVVRGEQGSRGTAGAFSYLLERYPALSAWLALQVKRRKVLLEQIHTDGALRTRLSGLTAVHVEFLRQCRSAGLTAADYPFNIADKALRVFSRRLKAEMLRNFGVAAHAAGATHLKGLPRVDDQVSSPTATRPYQVVEFDGHRLDIRLKVIITDPMGFARFATTHECALVDPHGQAASCDQPCVVLGPVPDSIDPFRLAALAFVLAHLPAKYRESTQFLPKLTEAASRPLRANVTPPQRSLFATTPFFAGGERETVELLGINVAQGAHETLDALIARGECELIDQILIDRTARCASGGPAVRSIRGAVRCGAVRCGAVRCGSLGERAKLSVVALLEASVAGGRGGGGVWVTVDSEPVVTMEKFADPDFSDSKNA